MHILQSLKNKIKKYKIVNYKAAIDNVDNNHISVDEVSSKINYRYEYNFEYYDLYKHIFDLSENNYSDCILAISTYNPGKIIYENDIVEAICEIIKIYTNPIITIDDNMKKFIEFTIRLLPSDPTDLIIALDNETPIGRDTIDSTVWRILQTRDVILENYRKNFKDKPYINMEIAKLESLNEHIVKNIVAKLWFS